MDIYKYSPNITNKNIDTILDFLKLIVSLCSLFVGGLVFKSGQIELDIYVKGAVLFSLSAILFSLMTFVHLAMFKASEDEYPNKLTSLYLYVTWQSFVFLIFILGAKFIL
jgi:hypothetical protein